MPKSVLITGCSTGLGRAAAELFADSGWNVTATMHNPACPGGTSLSALPNVFVTSLDVTSSASVKAAVSAAIQRFGSIDALVNNAGYATIGPLELAEEDAMKRQFDTNVLGSMRVMQAVLPGMRAARAGVVVNIASI